MFKLLGFGALICVTAVGISQAFVRQSAKDAAAAGPATEAEAESDGTASP